VRGIFDGLSIFLKYSLLFSFSSLFNDKTGRNLLKYTWSPLSKDVLTSLMKDSHSVVLYILLFQFPVFSEIFRYIPPFVILNCIDFLVIFFRMPNYM